jgi:CRP-like cAMP-binding protein
MRKVLFLFGTLNDSDIDWILSVGKPRKVAVGTVLIEQGSAIDVIYIILDGAFSVSVRRPQPREVARLQAGEVVGEMSFVDSRPTSASVIALEPSEVLAIPRSELCRRLGDAGFAARFYRALSIFLADRLRTTVARYGYEKLEPPRGARDSDSEVDPWVLENVAVAGARFDHLLRQVRERQTVSP